MRIKGNFKKSNNIHHRVLSGKLFGLGVHDHGGTELQGPISFLKSFERNAPSFICFRQDQMSVSHPLISGYPLQHAFKMYFLICLFYILPFMNRQKKYFLTVFTKHSDYAHKIWYVYIYTTHCNTR